MVKCELCGKTFKTISWKHLKFKHGLTVAQYRELGYRTGIERDCVICGKMFVPNYPKQRSCGNKCGAILHGQSISGENHPTRWGKTFSHSEETKQKIRENNAHYWQGKKRPGVGKKISAKLKGRPNLALKGQKFPGRKNSGQFSKGIEPWNKGKTGVYTPEQIRHISEGTKRNALRGPDNPAWKGGIVRLIDEDRQTSQYSEWRTAVFRRDNYTCQICEQIGGKLVAHHIKSYADFPELRFEVNNGITLCRSDHSRLHNNPRFACQFLHLLGSTEEL